MTSTDMSIADIQGLPPATACVVCERPIQAIGGRRLVAQPRRGSKVFNEAVTGGFKNFHSCTRLLQDRDLHLVIWGEKAFLTEGVINRIKATYLEGRRPWFCQVCGSRSCHLCGGLLPRPVMSDYLFDDGGTVHCPCLGADLGCWNPACERHRPDQVRPEFL